VQASVTMTPKPTKKRKPSARELANLKPHPKNLRPGGKPKLTYTQLEFCALIAHGIAVPQACLELGVATWQGHNWTRRNELVRKLITEYQEQLKINAFEKIAEKIELRTEFLDRHTITRLQKAKKTDMAISKLIHTGYLRTGAIKSTSISATAQAAAAAAAHGVTGGTMRQVYKSQWLRDKEAELAAECEKEYAANRLLPDKTASE
jgi:hypothetical protein